MDSPSAPNTSFDSHGGYRLVKPVAHPAVRPRALDRVLVTGGTGFIGGRLMRRLSESGSQVLAPLRPGNLHRLPTLPNVTPCELDHHSEKDWHPLVGQVDTVIHLAGATSGTRDELMQVNRDITSSIAMACSQWDSPPRLLVVSSLSAAGPSARNRPRSVMDPPSPVSVYGLSKLEGERAALVHADRVPITIVRPGIVFGPGDRELVRLLDPIARLGVNPLPGYHNPKVAFVHVDDCIDAILAAAVHGATCRGSEPHERDGRGVYFVADPEFLALTDFGKQVAKGLGRSWVFNIPVPIPLVQGVAMASDGVCRWMGWRSTFNPDKIREAACAGWTCDLDPTIRELGWSPTKPLTERLRAFAAEHR